MVGFWILLGGIVVGLVAMIWWGSGGPPTRPRPRSRYRGPVYMSVDRKLRRRSRR